MTSCDWMFLSDCGAFRKHPAGCLNSFSWSKVRIRSGANKPGIYLFFLHIFLPQNIFHKNLSVKSLRQNKESTEVKHLQRENHKTLQELRSNLDRNQGPFSPGRRLNCSSGQKKHRLNISVTEPWNSTDWKNTADHETTFMQMEQRGTDAQTQYNKH